MLRMEKLIMISINNENSKWKLIVVQFWIHIDIDVLQTNTKYPFVRRKINNAYVTDVYRWSDNTRAIPSGSAFCKL